MQTRRITMAAIATAAVLLGSACGGGNGSSDTPTTVPTVPTAAATLPPASPTPTTVPTPTPVPAGAATQLYIPTIGSPKAVERVGLTKANAIDTPKAQGAVGLFEGLAKPGEPGNSFWVGTRDGAFGGRLDTVRLDAEVFVVTESGGRFVYLVKSLTKYTRADINMAKILYPTMEPGERRMTIITSADLDPQTGDDLSWWVVVATMSQ